jgi:cytochrome c biogenesis protein
LYRFFRSLKFAVVLILILTGLSVIATLIPQGREPSFYFTDYPNFGAVLVILGFDQLFRSFLFLLPTVLFFISLVLCTIHRLVTRLRTGARRRFGPDLIHIGLLVLMIGALVTFFGRTEDVIQLREGDSAEIPGGYVLSLEKFNFDLYEDGSPKDWISVVNVTRDGEVVTESTIVEVNSPLKLGGLKLYQASYGFEEGIVLADLEGRSYWLTAGDFIPLADGTGMVLQGIGPAPLGAGDVATFEVWEGHDVREYRTEVAGAVLGEWIMTDVVFGYFTGLQMVHDPGYGTVLAALILITVGLFLTYIQKIGDNQV